MAYRVVHNYYRQEHFDFYRAYERPFYGLTWHLQIARVRQFCSQHGYSSYLGLCYFFTRGMAEVEDFRYRLVGDQIVLYDLLHPGATVPAPDGRFSFLYMRYDADVHAFMRDAMERRERAQRAASLAKSVEPNYIFFTAIPGVRFTSFAHTQPTVPTDAEPRVAFGQYVSDEGGTTVAVGILVNHLFIDGRALGELAERVQWWLDHPAEAR